MKRSTFAFPYLVWMIIFILVPLVLVVVYAFTNSDMEFTTEYIVKAFNADSLGILGRSAWVALLTTLICIGLAYPAAYLLSKIKSSSSTMISVFFMIPMWMNFLLRTYAWRTLLDNSGIINQFLNAIGLDSMQFLYTENAILFGLVYNYLPFMILPIYSVLQKMDQSCIEAAKDLGANKVQTFLKVELPLSKQGIISGIIMVFMPAMTTFVIPRILGGGTQLYYGDYIENQFLLLNDWNFGSALSVVLMVIMFISLIIFSKNDKDGTGATLL